MTTLDANLYAVKWGAYSVVVATRDAPTARRVFVDWLSTTHGVFTNPMTLATPKRVRSLGDRPLIIEA